MRRVPAALIVFLLLLMACPPAFALRLVAGSVSVSQSWDSGASWQNVNPGGTVALGNYFRITMTLENNTGLLGNMCADPGPPPPPPSATTCPAYIWDCGAQNNGMMDQGLWGQWPGQWWVWPVMGTCPNGVYPDTGGSPVSLVSAEPVTTFHYNGRFLNTVEAYNPATDTWTTKAAMPTARARFGVAVAGGKFYVIGGRNDTNVLGANEMYDPATNTWTTKTAMPTPREGLAVAAANGKIYAIGGRGTAGAVLGVVEEYDPGANSWTTKAAMPTPRYGVAAATLSGTVFATGGYDGSAYSAYGTVEAYKPGANTWATVLSLTYSRGDLAAVADGTYAWAVGGWDWACSGLYVERYDAKADSWSDGAGLNYRRARLAMASLAGTLYAVGGAQDSVWLGSCWGVVDPLAVADNEEYAPGVGAWTGKADMPTARMWLGAAVANVAGTNYVFAIGGYTGFRYADVTGLGETNNTARVSWTFAARTAWSGLDFSVSAVDMDDGYYCSPGVSEGGYYECSLPGFMGDVTLGTVLATEWGGTLSISSPLESSSRAEIVSPGSRPPGVAYVGDTVRVVTSVTNTGGATTIDPVDACCAWHPNGPADPPNGAPSPPRGNVCLTPLTPQGSCSANASEPGSPALPDIINSGQNKTYSWDFVAEGLGFFSGFPACSVGSVGSGSAYFDVTIKTATSQAATLYVQPAPLRVTATSWVDPDGPGGPEIPVPMGYDDGNGAALTYYHMGMESVEVTFIYTNTSPVYSFDIQPDMAVGGFDPKAFVMLGGATPSGPLLLAPGQSATVGWSFTRTPGGTLDSCVPSVVGQLATFTCVARGAAATQPVVISDVPFHPDGEPLTILPGAVPGGATPDSRNLTFDVPTWATMGQAFSVNLYATNTEARDFVLDPAATLFLSVSSYGGTVSWSSSPSPAPITWAGGQTRTFQWGYTATGLGEVGFLAGLDFKAAAPPCLYACGGKPGDAQPYYCNSTESAYFPARRLSVTIPTMLSVTDFTADPAVSCDDPTQAVVLRIGVRNTSSLYCAVVNNFCDWNYPDAVPTGYAQPYATAPSPYPPVASPVPALPVTIAPGAVEVFTWYMDAFCPPSGTIAFGCWSKTRHMVEGYATDCVSTTVAPSITADWGGPSPGATIIRPAYLSCSIWTDNSDYVGGQTITVRFSVSSEGGEGLTAFSVTVTAFLQLGASVLPVTGPVPAPPPTMAGNGDCGTWTPAATGFYVFTFTASQSGRVTFQGVATGTGSGACPPFSSVVAAPVIRLAGPSVLSCSGWATSSVTMTRSCAGCPPVSQCGTGGKGCVVAEIYAINTGGGVVRNVEASASLVDCSALSCSTLQSAVGGVTLFSWPSGAADVWSLG